MFIHFLNMYVYISNKNFLIKILWGNYEQFNYERNVCFILINVIVFIIYCSMISILRQIKNLLKIYLHLNQFFIYQV